MKKTRALCMILMVVCTVSLLSGCGAKTSTKEKAANTNSEEHEPITICDYNRDYTKLIELVHEKYPEINIKIEPYKGGNTTGYMKKQIETGSMPDIYVTTQAWDEELQKEHLVDLSKYPVSELYNQVRLNEYDIDGGIYLLPYDYVVQGILYNKTLFEKNNIEVPTSFRQLREETIPALKEAGIEISTDLMNMPGYSFQYFFDVAYTGELNTLEGKTWMDDFTAGNVTAADFLKPNVERFGQWINCGMINLNYESSEAADILEHYSEGNTAFWLGGNIRFSQNEDGTGDQYGLMPYLSEDGTRNVYITQVSRSYGLNKELEKEGNEQKLEDALHFLEVMSTNEGFNALIASGSSSMCSIKNFEIADDSPYKDAVEDINNGHSGALVYAGWENYIVPFGEAIKDWIGGEMSGEEAVEALDKCQEEFLKNGTTYYADVTEELDTKQAAQLVGQMFLEAADTDAVLISYNVYYDDVPSNLENGYGVNGKILKGKMSEEDIMIFLPTGWYGTLQSSKLTGAQIKEMAQTGCDIRGNGHTYPYVFLTKDGKELEDDKEYSVVVCGYTKDTEDKLNQQDTGIVGLDAAKEYLEKVKEVSSKTLDDSLVKNND